MNNKYMPLVVVAAVSLLVGLFGGYYYEKTKLSGMMASEVESYKMQLDQAKKSDSMMKDDSEKMSSGPVMMAKTGGYETAENGMTLYTYDKDTKNVSNCAGQCLVNWPPYVTNGTVPSTLPEHLGIFKKSDGSMQYTWDGMPLYFYIKDTKPGDITGDGVGGVWHLVK